MCFGLSTELYFSLRSCTDACFCILSGVRYLLALRWLTHQPTHSITHSLLVCRFIAAGKPPPRQQRQRRCRQIGRFRSSHRSEERQFLLVRWVSSSVLLLLYLPIDSVYNYYVTAGIDVLCIDSSMAFIPIGNLWADSRDSTQILRVIHVLSSLSYWFLSISKDGICLSRMLFALLIINFVVITFSTQPLGNNCNQLVGIWITHTYVSIFAYPFLT